MHMVRATGRRGCGLVLNGEVVRGVSGNAGEIGHVIVDPDGPECDCGQRGCVKSSAIPQVLVAKAVATGVLDGPEEGHSAPAVQERFAEPLRHGRTAAMQCSVAILRDSAVLVSRAVSAVINALDVDRVVFGGPFWTCLAPAYLELVPGLVAGNSDTGKIHGVGGGQHTGTWCDAVSCRQPPAWCWSTCSPRAPRGCCWRADAR